MPNDIPDWTAQAKSNLVGGISGLNLGDVGAPSLSADAFSETASDGLQASGVTASFKPAAGATIAKVGALGAILAGSATSVSPLFGQSPTAGNLLVAWVRAAASATEPTTVAAGWVKDKSVNGSGGWAQVWHKPNAAGGDAAPTFTQSNAGVSVMIAQLGEFSGVATAAPTDQTGSGDVNPGAVLSAANAAADVAFGDLVLMAANWITNSLSTTFVDTANNGAAAVNAGNLVTSFGGGFRGASFVFAIVPAATVAQPLGVAEWAYDATGTSAPGGGTQASVVLAATPGKTYTAAMIDASDLLNVAGPNNSNLQLLDGVTVKWSMRMDTQQLAGQSVQLPATPRAIPGTKGNSMTLQFAAGVTNVFQSANLGAYLR